MNDDQIYLKYIGEGIERIEEYTVGGKETFLASLMVQDATIRRLQTLTETTQRLSDELKARASQIDWRGISGLRNILVHEYLGGIDLDIIWDVIERDLPELKEKVKALLTELKEQEGNGN